eukprot:CAMPEP_0115878296 /NCGR_PEP_ID=MMETSP0287-20121206/26697_1 /TAXON_ID=412157 /ORGANISM="Chrysochromulina rotalis, Strain UIO044" /LENGTH=264 /DNA_ID=CAMNT_0003333901 /DNA_START=530 /DNA_END=1327 /DNA_ORIENTATION=-
MARITGLAVDEGCSTADRPERAERPWGPKHAGRGAAYGQPVRATARARIRAREKVRLEEETERAAKFRHPQAAAIIASCVAGIALIPHGDAGGSVLSSQRRCRLSEALAKAVFGLFQLEGPCPFAQQCALRPAQVPNRDAALAVREEAQALTRCVLRAHLACARRRGISHYGSLGLRKSIAVDNREACAALVVGPLRCNCFRVVVIAVALHGYDTLHEVIIGPATKSACAHAVRKAWEGVIAFIILDATVSPFRKARSDDHAAG